MREYWENIALGALQGLTEFLPVSSSGHLVALETVIGSTGQDDLTREIFLHFATLLAVMVFFRRELSSMVHGAVAGGEGRALFFKVVLACTPAGVVGYLGKHWVEELPGRWPLAIPGCWLLMAGILWTLRKPRSDRPVDIGYGIALWIGVWQILALLPGISRAGVTIAAALWLNSRPREAASFSFILSVPLILGASLLELLKADSASLGGVGPSLAGGITAFVTGFLALKILLQMVVRGSLHLWSYYLIVIAFLYGRWLLMGSK